MRTLLTLLFALGLPVALCAATVQAKGLGTGETAPVEADPPSTAIALEPAIPPRPEPLPGRFERWPNPIVDHLDPRDDVEPVSTAETASDADEPIQSSATPTAPLVPSETLVLLADR